ncbi:MAG: tRNA 2-thiouridine(34) synthase MnmA [Bacteroidales bacterium]|nr:tRNA 2-thiouridine(34) synthase MnmA [Bacteroidales bacterium]
METIKKHVVIGLSGGVDSSVAAWMLLQQGYQVSGLFMVNWHDTTGLLEGDCPAEHDLLLARLVARKLNIPLYEADFSKEYSERVVDYMFSEYEKGRTPNPDVLCNREIKFDPFIKKALELGADYFATGHYCRKTETTENGTTTHHLLAGSDPGKDQSYFLCQLSQQQLEKVLFPIGHLLKPEVRKIASELGLATAERKDSQGICFVGKVDLPVFLQQKLKSKEGKVIEIAKSFAYPPSHSPVLQPETLSNEDLLHLSKPYQHSEKDGLLTGKHQGAHFLTIGQRKGLNIGGKLEPLFVLETDVVNNLVFVGQGQDHPGLYRSILHILPEEIHHITTQLNPTSGKQYELLVRVRYRQPLQEAMLLFRENGLFIVFKEPQRGITPGQFAAWYDQEELLGSGIIS